jgi:predicted regulator of Ras-like GTPase activity (Roadblock/LC7/MglB family)
VTDLAVATATEALRACLAELVRAPGVQFAAIVDRQGFLIDALGAVTIGMDSAAAVAGCLGDVAARVGQELGQGGLVGQIVQFEGGAMLVHAVGDAAAVVLGAEDAVALAGMWPRVSESIPTLARVL